MDLIAKRNVRLGQGAQLGSLWGFGWGERGGEVLGRGAEGREEEWRSARKLGVRADPRSAERLHVCVARALL